MIVVELKFLISFGLLVSLNTYNNPCKFGQLDWWVTAIGIHGLISGTYYYRIANLIKKHNIALDIAEEI